MEKATQLYHRYDVQVDRFGETKLRITVYDYHWDSHDYAFLPKGRRWTRELASYSDVAVRKVTEVLKAVGLEGRLDQLETETTYRCFSEGPFEHTIKVQAIKARPI